MKNKKIILDKLKDGIEQLKDGIEQLDFCMTLDVKEFGHIIHIYHDIFLKKIQHGNRLLALHLGVDGNIFSIEECNQCNLKQLSIESIALIHLMKNTVRVHEESYLQLLQLTSKYEHAFEVWYQQREAMIKDNDKLFQNENRLRLAQMLHRIYNKEKEIFLQENPKS